MPPGYDKNGKLPLKLAARWEKGVVRSSQIDASSRLPPHLAKTKDASKEPKPCRSLHAPLTLAASSFAQRFYQEAKAQSIKIKSLKVTATSKANFSAFYDNHTNNDTSNRRNSLLLLSLMQQPSPWKCIELEVRVDSDDASQSELEELSALAMVAESPTLELLEEHFTISVGIDYNNIKKKKDKPNATARSYSLKDCYNIEEYKSLGEGRNSGAAEIAHKQVVVCRLKQTQDKIPYLHMKLDSGNSFGLSVLETVPFGTTPDGFPTPVQAFMFDTLAMYMHTFALRLGKRGDTSLKGLTGTFSVVMENGVKDYDDGLEAAVFSVMGGKIHLSVHCDEKRPLIDNAFHETQSMSPSYLAVTGKVDVDLDITKGRSK